MIHDWLKPQWNQVLAGADRMPHALLLAGPSGVGKREFAEALAARMLCERARGAEAACGACASCVLITTDNHPDLLTVRPEALDDEAGEGDEAEAKSR